MSKRTRATLEENPAPEAEEDQDPPAETRRTRSGRRVRTPAVLSASEAPGRTPGRRTRRSVLQEQPAQEVQTPEEKREETSAEAESRRGLAGSETGAPAAETEIEAPAAVIEAEPPVAETKAEAPAAVIEAEPPAAETQVTAADSDQTEVKGGSRPTETAPVSSKSIPQKKPRLAPSVKQTPVVPLGKPKSGRVWKDRNKQRFSALVRDKPLCSSWEKKMEAKREMALMKKYSLQLKEEKDRQKEDKRKRREENLRRRAENERKAEIVQVIRNTAKIKRMKKKQLRKIEKRDTLAMLQKSQKQNVKTKAQKTINQDFT